MRSCFVREIPGDTLFVILDGEVRVCRSDDQDNEIELARLKSGEFFGELALLDGKARSARVTTVTPCQFFFAWAA